MKMELARADVGFALPTGKDRALKTDSKKEGQRPKVRKSKVTTC
jgi:hypothetical protein